MFVIIFNQLNSTWGKKLINFIQNVLVISNFRTTV